MKTYLYVITGYIQTLVLPSNKSVKLRRIIELSDFKLKAQKFKTFFYIFNIFNTLQPNIQRKTIYFLQWEILAVVYNLEIFSSVS